MEDELFKTLFECRKILLETLIKLPQPGEQNVFDARKYNDEHEKFKVIVNRKGHYNPDNLTYQLTSRFGILVRIDMSGAPHANIDTPHVHIFNKEFDFGRKAIALNDITDAILLKDMIDSFTFFLRYNNIDTVDINSTLF